MGQVNLDDILRVRLASIGKPMNPDAKRAWVAALRSGRYHQGPGRLRVTRNGRDEFCCLGVLCDLGKHRDIRWKRSAVFDGEWFYSGSSSILSAGLSYLPDVVRDAAGLDGKIEDALVQANDEGVTFCQIADAIEEYL